MQRETHQDAWEQELATDGCSQSAGIWEETRIYGEDEQMSAELHGLKCRLLPDGQQIPLAAITASNKELNLL